MLRNLLAGLTLTLGHLHPAVAENCEPLRNCDATRDCTPKRNCDAVRDCTLQVDTRNCEGLGKYLCEVAKAAQNRGYEAAKAHCEAQKSLEKFDCERIKALEKPACEAQKTLEKLDCERLKTQERASCELGLAGPWRCSAQEVMLQLRTQKQAKLTDFDELSAYLTTPLLKNPMGQLAWRDTACVGVGIGIPYINSQNSTDGFCTIDVELISFTIENVQKPPGGRYLRLEVLPGGKASSLCRSQTITTFDVIRFAGPIRRDWHPSERWLEVHVTQDLEILPNNAALQIASVDSVHPVLIGTAHTVVDGESLSRISTAAYGAENWQRIYQANRARIKNPDLVYPKQLLVIPPAPAEDKRPAAIEEKSKHLRPYDRSPALCQAHRRSTEDCSRTIAVRPRSSGPHTKQTLDR